MFRDDMFRDLHRISNRSATTCAVDERLSRVLHKLRLFRQSLAAAKNMFANCAARCSGDFPPPPSAEKGTARQNDPNITHHPDALPQGDARPWPARHGCPVGRLCHLEAQCRGPRATKDVKRTRVADI